MPRLLNNEELARLSASLERTSDAPRSIGQAEMSLAYQLSQIHGNILLTREAGGLHLYMASPVCLREDGKVELVKRHLAVNVDRYLAGRDKSAMCMKSGQPFKVSDLLAMRPLKERGYAAPNKVTINEAATNAEYLEPDQYGRMIPKSPGEVLSLAVLPDEHVGIQYLKQRQYNPMELVRRFRASWCIQERSDMWYQKICNGFKATPQNRVVFYVDQQGKQVGWQARIMEHTDGDLRYYLHPYKSEWVPIEQKGQKLDKKTQQLVPGWIPLKGWEDWDPKKYIMSHGAKRNQCLMGYDMAVEYSRTHRDSRGRRYCLALEGPLDAGRMSDAAVATLGKFFSPSQLALIEVSFDRLIYIKDNDTAGEEAAAKLRELAAESPLQIDVVSPPADVKDVGELSPAVAQLFETAVVEGRWNS